MFMMMSPTSYVTDDVNIDVTAVVVLWVMLMIITHFVLLMTLSLLLCYW